MADGSRSLPLDPDREFLIHVAKVHLAEASRRRHDRVSRDFYWTLLAWAANARRRAIEYPAQRGLFA